MPNITVGIPFYKEEDPEHLRQAISSVQNQTYRPSTIHLIQDGEIHGSLKDVVDESMSSDKSIEHIRIESNQGLSHALNRSILDADTPLYARMDANDVSTPKRFERQVDYLMSNTDVKIVGTWAHEFIGNFSEKDAFLKKVPTEQEKMASLLHYKSPFVHATVMFRRDVFADIGLYPHRDKIEDLCLWSRVFHRDITVANIPESLYHIRFDGVAERRSSLDRVWREAKMRFRYWTFSPVLNILKLSSLLFRILPTKLQEKLYHEEWIR